MVQKLLEKYLPSDRFLSSDGDLQFYGKDACKDFAANPSLIIQPTTVEEVSTLLKICNENDIAVVPSGGRTGYSGGATATHQEIICSLSRLNKVIAVDPAAQTITCEAGVTTEVIQREAEKHKLFYGVDFASKGSSQIGGNIATNAGGIRVIRYGNTRDWVLGLKVVLASGEIITCNGSLIKNQTGYDLRHLFIGSEGTLGIIVEATLKLASRPKDSTTGLCGLAVDHLLPLLQRIRSKGFVVNVFECLDKSCAELVLDKTDLRNPFQAKYPMYALVEVETPTEKDKESFDEFLGGLLEEGLIDDVVVAQSEGQRQELVGLRERISETIGKHFVPHKNDVSVPVTSVSDFIVECTQSLRRLYPDFSFLIFGHVGDGNLHINTLKPDAMSVEDFQKKTFEADHNLFKVVQKYHGSISAEHGVGLLKKPFLSYSRSPEEIELFRAIKKAFDPKGVLNPRKIFE